MNASLRRLMIEERFALIDAHHHLWSLQQPSYPWLQERYDADTFMGDYRELRRDYLVPDYLADIGALRLAATVHVEAERRRDQALDESRWLDEVAAQFSLPSVIVAYVNLWQDAPGAALDEHRRVSARLRGVRCKPTTSATPLASVAGAPGSLQDQAWARGLAALADRGLVWDLRLPWWHLREAVPWAQDFPNLSIVLNHAGLPWDRSEAGLAEWRAAMATLARCHNVHVKLSEFAVRGEPWREGQVRQIVRDVVELFGPHRCMFASNFPVARLKVDFGRAVSVVADAIQPWGDAGLKQVFRDTARRVYRIEI